MNRMLFALGAVALAGLTALPSTVAAQARTGSLGGGAGSGPVMTRDELRACLKSQVDLKKRVADYEAMKTALDAEKAAIQAETQRLGMDRGAVAGEAARVDTVNARQAELSRRIDEWNVRWQEFEKANRSGPFADRQRRQLLDEQKAMEREGAALEAERKSMTGTAGKAAEVNKAADAVNARVVAWNQRNKEVAKAGEDLLQERDLWAGECGNRRFREEDEIAIRQGK